MIKPPSIIPSSIAAKSHYLTEYCQQIATHPRYQMYVTKQERIQHHLIESFLSLEGMPLSTNQVIKVLKGNNIRAPLQDIKEVNNIAKLCRHLYHMNPLSTADFKKAHHLILLNLDDNSGKWRKDQVFVFEGKKVAHIPPAGKQVVSLMRSYFQFVRKNSKVSWLIKACVLHYGIQYVHPFDDGNGRMGRIWQHLLLQKESPVFKTVLIGNIIKKHHLSYYRVLDQCDKARNMNGFIEFCFKHIQTELNRINRKLKLKIRPTSSLL
jgi:Fic family protein